MSDNVDRIGSAPEETQPSGGLEGLLKEFEPILERFGPRKYQEKVLGTTYEMVERHVAGQVKERLLAPDWSPPELSEGDSLTEQLAHPPEPIRYLVDGLAGIRHNVTLAAQYKTGKTTTMFTLVRALVDSGDFLGRSTNLAADAAVAFWNGEMDIADWLNDMRQVGVQNRDRVFPLHLRGERMNLLDDRVADWTVSWLAARNVKVWVLDSWRVLCAWCGVHENDNSGGGLLLARIDEIKARAGVDAFVMLVHTGRKEHEEGKEHGRGMTNLDDWVDTRWLMTRRGADRFFHAEGRRTGMKKAALTFDPDTLSVGVGESHHMTEAVDLTAQIWTLVTDADERLTVNKIWKLLPEDVRPGAAKTVERRLQTLEKEGRLQSFPAKGRPTLWGATLPDWPGSAVEGSASHRST